MAKKKGYKRRARNFGEAVLPYPGQYGASALSMGKTVGWLAGAITATYAGGWALRKGLRAISAQVPTEGVLGKVIDVATDIIAANVVAKMAARHVPSRSKAIYTAALAVPVLNVIMPTQYGSNLPDTIMKTIGLKGWDEDMGYSWNLGTLMDDGMDGFGPGNTLLEGMNDYASLPQSENYVHTYAGPTAHKLQQVPRHPAKAKRMGDYASMPQARNPAMGDFTSIPAIAQAPRLMAGEDIGLSDDMDGLADSVARAEVY